MRCLVLGGTGMLGRAVVAEARSRGWAALGLSHAQADLADCGRLLGWAERFRPEVVVNCAAYTKVDAAEADRERAFAVNGAGGLRDRPLSGPGARLLVRFRGRDRPPLVRRGRGDPGHLRGISPSRPPSGLLGPGRRAF